MIDYTKFVCNIYDPRMPDSDDYLVSKNAAPEKKVALLKYMRDLLDQYEIGEPCETYARNFANLKANNIVGLYKCERTNNADAIKLLADFSVKPREITTETETPAKGKFQMAFKKRPKQMYKFPQIINDKTEQLTIDDYVPPKPMAMDDD